MNVTSRSRNIAPVPVFTVFNVFKASNMLSAGVIGNSSGSIEGGRLEWSKDPTYDADLAAFSKLLGEGADPRSVRIAGYKPAEESPLPPGFASPVQGMMQITLGDSGHVAADGEDGLTLLHYCTANKLGRVCSFLAATSQVHKAASKGSHPKTRKS